MPTRIYKDDGLHRKWKFLRKVCEDYRLSLAGRLVMVELLFHHNTKTGDCFPGVKRIADALGISERQVQRSIAQLIKIKWLSSKRRYNKSNLYVFNVVSDKNLMTTQESWGGDTGVVSMTTQESRNDDSSGGLTSKENKGSEQENLTPGGEEEIQIPLTEKKTSNTKNGLVKAKYNPLDPKDNPYAKPDIDPPNTNESSSVADACWNEIKDIFPACEYGHDWDKGRELFDHLVADGIDLKWLMTQAYRYVESVKKREPQFISPIQRWFSEGRYKKELPKTFMETHSEFMANQRAESAKYREEQASKDSAVQMTPEEYEDIIASCPRSQWE